MDTERLIYKTVESQAEIVDALSFFDTVLVHKMNNEIWEWEFNTLPGTILAIAKNPDSIVGSQVMFPVTLNVDDEEVVSGKSENSHVINEYRGMGVFKALYNYAEEMCRSNNIFFLWGFTPAIKALERNLDFTVYPDVMCDFSLVISMPSFHFLRLYNKGASAFIASFLLYARKFLTYKLRFSLFSSEARLADKAPKYTIRKQVNSFSDLDRMYEKLRLKMGNFTHLKISEAFFDWRIKNNPAKNYSTWFFYEGERLAGYYIVSMRKTSAHICDFTALHDEVRNVMVVHLLKESKKMKALKIYYFGNTDNELNKINFNLFKRFGGIVKPNRAMHFIYKSLSPANHYDAVLKHSRNWYLNGLWTQGFIY